jgi:NTE family protein
MKKQLLLLLCLSLFHLTLVAQEVPTEKPKVAVVLAGGGALGYAHVGALQVLEEEGIRPDIVLGTSMGSIVGGLYCAGYSPKELKEIIETTNWTEVFIDSFNRRDMSYVQKLRDSQYHLLLDNRTEQELVNAGVSHGQHVMEFLDKLLINYNKEMDFDDLPIPFRAIGTDLLTGEEVIFDQGDLKTAIRSSMSVPGVFTPVEYENHYLIDGGWVDNLPATVARELGADIVISVSLFGLTDNKENLTTITEVVNQSDLIKTKEKLFTSVAASDLVISPDLTGYTQADFEEGATLMVRGYEAADKMRTEIAQLAQEINAPPLTPRHYIVSHQKVQINEVRKIDGSQDSLTQTISSDLEELYYSNPTGKELKEYIYSYYDGGEYTHFWYRLKENDNGSYLLEIDNPQAGESDSMLGFSLEGSSYLSQLDITDLELKGIWGFRFGKNKNHALFGDFNIAEFPGMSLGLRGRYLGESALTLVKTYALVEPCYFYEDDSIDSIYSRKRLGGMATIQFPFFRVISFSNTAYYDYNSIEHYLGSKDLEEDNWYRYGVSFSGSFDDLDRIVAPQRGLNFYGQFNSSLDGNGDILGYTQVAGESYTPLLNKNVIVRTGLEMLLTHWGEWNSFDLIKVGDKLGMTGFYNQELGDNNFLMGQLGMRIKIGKLPLGFGEEIYAQFGGSLIALSNEILFDSNDDLSLYESGYAGIMLSTLLGEIQLNGYLNSSDRFSLYLGLKTSTSLE